MSDFWKKVGTTINKIGSSASSLGNITGLASSISGIIGSLTQGKQQRNLLKYQDQLADENYQQQLKDQWAMYERQFADQKSMIDAQNQYNSYSSVRKRAEQAGINPLAAITGQTGSIGIQAQAGNTPSASTPSGYTGTSALSDIGVGHLITGGASLMAQSRENMMFEEQLRSLKLQNDLDEIDLKWKDKNYVQDYQNKESYKSLLDAQVLSEKASARYTTAKAELDEQAKDFNDKMNPILLTQADTSLQLMREQLFQAEFKTDNQKRVLEAQLAESSATVYSMIQAIYQNWSRVMLEADRNNLGWADLKELNRHNKEVEKLNERIQDHKEKYDKKNFTKDVVFGSIDSLCDIVKSASSLMNSDVGKYITSILLFAR